MESLRAAALQEFRQNSKHWFRDPDDEGPNRPLSHLQVISVDFRATTNQVSRTSMSVADAVERFKHPVGNTLLLVGVPVDLPAEGKYHIAHADFMELFEASEIDPYMLEPFSDSAAFYLHTTRNASVGDGGKLESFFFMADRFHHCWGFDNSNHCLRGFFCGIAEEQDIYIMDLLDLLKQHISWLNQCCGFLFINVLHMLYQGSNSLDNRVVDIRNVENLAGHGYGQMSESALDVDRGAGLDTLIMWSKMMSVAKQALIIMEYNVNMCRQALKTLSSSKPDGEPSISDVEAVRIISSFAELQLRRIGMFKARADNQSTALFNLIAREDARESRRLTDVNIKIAEESKRLTDANLKIAAAAKADSQAMKTVAIMTMLFLPGTFFAALFSMPTLRWDTPDVISGQFWIYWVFTICSTIAVFVVWFFTTYKGHNHFRSSLPNEAASVDDRVSDSDDDGSSMRRSEMSGSRLSQIRRRAFARKLSYEGGNGEFEINGVVGGNRTTPDEQV